MSDDVINKLLQVVNISPLDNNAGYLFEKLTSSVFTLNVVTAADGSQTLDISGDIGAGGLTIDAEQTFLFANGLKFGDGGAGFYEQADGILTFQSNGTDQWVFSGSIFTGNISGSGTLINWQASFTQPSIIPYGGDWNSGLGGDGADSISIIAGGVEALRVTENTGVLFTEQMNAGLTADVGSAQGGTPLTSSNNEIATCANVGDSVTLPAASAGRKCFIINNGANAADVFPAVGDDAGAGVNVAVSLAAGANITYKAYDATNWTGVT